MSPSETAKAILANLTTALEENHLQKTKFQSVILWESSTSKKETAISTLKQFSISLVESLGLQKTEVDGTNIIDAIKNLCAKFKNNSQEH